MFKPNLTCVLYKATGFDRHARPMLDGGTITPCAVVHLRQYAEKSTVRTDQGASGGAADENKTEVKMLIHKASKVSLNDVIHVLDMKVRVTSIEKRINVKGILDHIEIQGDVWSGAE